MGAGALSFDFATAARILFGEGRIAEAGAIAAELGAHALLVSSGSERSAVVVASLHEHGIAGFALNAGVNVSPLWLAAEAAKREARAKADARIASHGGP